MQHATHVLLWCVSGTLRESREHDFVPIALSPDPLSIDSLECRPSERTLLALLDVEARIVVGDEEPLVVVDFRIARLRTMPRIAFGIDRHHVANSRLRCRVEVDAANERYGSGPLVEFNHVVAHILRQVLPSFRNRIAESIFVISMNVNGTADFFTDRGSFQTRVSDTTARKGSS